MKSLSFGGMLLVQPRLPVLVGLLSIVAASFAKETKIQDGTVPPSSESQSLKSANSIWPNVPHSDDSALAQNPKPGKQRIPVTEFSEPRLKPPTNDPLEEINDMGLVQGQLVYTPTIQVEGHSESQRLLVLRRVGIEGEATRTGLEVATYNLKIPWYYVFNSQFSPDGRYISFNEGDPFERSIYQTFVWDTLGKRLSRIKPDTLLHVYNKYLYWSPGSTSLAFVYVSDINRRRMNDNQRLQLRVYDVRTHQERVVATGISVAGETASIAWTHRGTLLYSPPLETKEAFDPARMNIHEVSIRGGKSQIIIKGGANPVPAPNGRWIAFLGAPNNSPVANAATKSARPRPALYLFDRQSQTRILLDAQTPDDVRWTRDGQHLIVLHSQYKGKGQTEARLNLIDLSDIVRSNQVPQKVKAAKELAKLQAQRYQAVETSCRHFRLMDVTRDGSQVLVDVSEPKGFDHNLPSEDKTLLAVSLHDGKVTMVARLESKWASVIGWDWHDESVQEPDTNVLRAAKAEAEDVAKPTKAAAVAKPKLR